MPGAGALPDDQSIMFTGLDSPLHILIVLLVVLLLFGAKRLPELGRSLGTGMREFKDSVTGAAEHQELPRTPATELSRTPATGTDTRPDQPKS
jgi:sec-independent protein translocase protein TatA